jgi:protein-S-isoprenylcysteine O-methyltransferase Ste14
MYFWFLISIIGLIVIVPLHFLSVEHIKLQKRYGKDKGAKFGEILGFISGWGFFIFWMGLWLSPQLKFSLPIHPNVMIFIPIVNIQTSFLNLIFSVPFIIIGAWFGIEGVLGTTLKVAETHTTKKIVKTGIYSMIRHPQYFGGLMAHIGICFFLSAGYSLVVTPIMVILIYLISKKEEKELIKEFGREYQDYKKRVPMLIPRL